MADDVRGQDDQVASNQSVMSGRSGSTRVQS